jgi:hypothetical protein
LRRAVFEGLGVEESASYLRPVFEGLGGEEAVVPSADL